MYTIFHKEYRQQRALFAVMLLFCFLIQFGGYMLMKFFNGITIDFNAAALFSAALYAGAAATVAFAGECEDKTFNFLRRLPLTAETVMYGKTAWIILSTAVMLICSAALAVFWQLTDGGTANLGTQELWGILGTGIIETLVWGLFWSSRCRNPYYAVMLTYGCASVSAFLAANLISNAGTTSADAYFYAVPLRLGICAVAGIFAVRDMLKWFAPETTVQGRNAGEGENLLLRNSALLKLHFVSFSHTIKPPFTALMLHCIRQSRIMLLIGFILAVVYAVCSNTFVLCIFSVSFPSYYSDWGTKIYDTLLLDLFAVGFYLLFCGSIFAPDQKNETYRILTRFGITTGKVWLSRILPFALISMLAFFLFTGLHYKWVLEMLKVFSSYRYPAIEPITHTFIWTMLMPQFLSLWLIPFAAGSFISISFRNQIVASALTGAASLMLFIWMYAGLITCGFSPLWFVLPLCAALLLASYLQTNNCLKERSGWKMYLLPLLPFVLTGAVICAAVPPVRIYSIPFVPFSEIETALQNSSKIPAEKLKTLLQQTATVLDKPLTKEEWRQQDWRITPSYLFNLFLYQYPKTPEEIEYAESSGKLRYHLWKVQKALKTVSSFEESLLRSYSVKVRAIKTAVKPEEDTARKMFGFWISLYRYLPWEKERALRRQNVELLNCSKWTISAVPVFQGFFDFDFWHNNTPVFNELQYYREVFSDNRIQLVVLALECWYKEHNNTLPRTLDELVENGYLDSIPVDLFTGGKMLYYPDADKEKLEAYRKDSKRISSWIRHIPGWQCVSFTEDLDSSYYRTCDLRFLPDYWKYAKLGRE